MSFVDELSKAAGAMRIPGPGQKRCSDCGAVKEATDFYPKKGRCKSCSTIVRRRYPKQYSYKRKTATRSKVVYRKVH